MISDDKKESGAHTTFCARRAPVELTEAGLHDLLLTNATRHRSSRVPGRVRIRRFQLGHNRNP
jgi:hypothetical protein